MTKEELKETEELKEMIEIIKAVPNIDYKDRERKYTSVCPCGGTITAWRVAYNGHLRAYCNKCGFKLIE